MIRRQVGGLLLACAAVVGCGQGNAIISVDIWSFINTSSADTIPYIVPPLTSNFNASNVPQKISLVPGAGGSITDTVTISGNVNFVNSTGSGTLTLQIYLAADSASADTANAGIFPAPLQANVSPNTTTAVPIGPVNLTAKLDSLFTKSAIWFRMGTTVSNPGATTVQGKAIISALTLRVVISPKIF